MDAIVQRLSRLAKYFAEWCIVEITFTVAGALPAAKRFRGAHYPHLRWLEAQFRPYFAAGACGPAKLCAASAAVG